ncbi:MAG: protein kinase, partial [Nannocystaceae bacterium]
MFFGRTSETRILIERLRAEAFVLVAGDSGVGKSSLCRAGVAPQILAGALDRDRTWETINLIPGRRPLQSLIAALATSLDFHEASLSSLITTKLDSVGWFIRKKLGNTTGRLLLIDQLEEMVTIADPEEARLASAVLAQFAIGVPGMRTIATVRGDFLTRVAQLPALGDELMRAIYILRPLSPEALREAITGPAATQGVDFVLNVIDELVDAGREGSLPLLQFA